MGLPVDGEVTSHEVWEWAQEQAKHLSPTQTLVLWYLCLNAWRKPNHPEGSLPGQVLSGRVSISRIRVRTGLSERAIRNALRELRYAGYIIYDLKPGNGASEITVVWNEGADARREEYRAGVRDLPEYFQRPKKKPSKSNTGDLEHNILPFPLRHEVP